MSALFINVLKDILVIESFLAFVDSVNFHYAFCVAILFQDFNECPLAGKQLRTHILQILRVFLFVAIVFPFQQTKRVEHGENVTEHDFVVGVFKLLGGGFDDPVNVLTVDHFILKSKKTSNDFLVEETLSDIDLDVKSLGLEGDFVREKVAFPLQRLFFRF